jgi:hypothetical protein
MILRIEARISSIEGSGACSGFRIKTSAALVGISVPSKHAFTGKGAQFLSLRIVFRETGKHSPLFAGHTHRANA